MSVSIFTHPPPRKCQFFTKFMWNRHLLILANRPSTTCCPVHLTQLIEGKHRLPSQRNKEVSKDVKNMGRKKKRHRRRMSFTFCLLREFFWGVLCEFWGPILQVEAQSPRPGTHQCQQSDPPGPWLYMLHH